MGRAGEAARGGARSGAGRTFVTLCVSAFLFGVTVAAPPALLGQPVGRCCECNCSTEPFAPGFCVCTAPDIECTTLCADSAGCSATQEDPACGECSFDNDFCDEADCCPPSTATPTDTPTATPTATPTSTPNPCEPFGPCRFEANAALSGGGAGDQCSGLDCPSGFGCEEQLSPGVGAGFDNEFVCCCVPQTPTPTVTPTDTPTATPTATVDPVGCCTVDGICINDVIRPDCAAGLWIGNGICGDQCAGDTRTPTNTPTATSTATPTSTPVSEGGPCTETAQCETGLVCIDVVCTGSAPAPSTSRTGLLIGLGLLVTIAAVALWRRRELKHYLWSV